MSAFLEIPSDNIVELELIDAGEDAQGVQKSGDTSYHVKQMPREDIFGGEDYISAGGGHQMGPCSTEKKSKSVVEFNLTWSTKSGILPQGHIKWINTCNEKEEPLENCKT